VENGQTMFNIVFFVVLASSLIQGPTIGLMAQRLGLGRAPAAPEAEPEVVP
jgi:cell volume regulation protein A